MKFKKQLVLYAASLTGGRGWSGLREGELNPNGSLSIDIRFDPGITLEATLSAFVIGEFESGVKINEDRYVQDLGI